MKADRLAAKIERLLVDDALVETLRRRAQERVCAAYRWPDVVSAYEVLLTRAAAGGFKGRPPSDSGTTLVERVVCDPGQVGLVPGHGHKARAPRRA